MCLHGQNVSSHLKGEKLLDCKIPICTNFFFLTNSQVRYCPINGKEQCPCGLVTDHRDWQSSKGLQMHGPLRTLLSVTDEILFSKMPTRGKSMIAQVPIPQI